MTINKLKDAIRAELNRQNQESKAEGLHVYHDDENEIGVDGHLDLNELAKTLLSLFEHSGEQ